MNFFQNILSSVKNKAAEMKDRKEFLDMVESDAKPIRRKAYYNQMLKEVVQEGIDKAKQDAAKRVPKQKTKEDFGIKATPKDEWDFLDNIGKTKPTKKRKQTQ